MTEPALGTGGRWSDIIAGLAPPRHRKDHPIRHKISLSGVTSPKVLLDDIDIDNITTAVDVTLRPGEPVRVTLSLLPGVLVIGDCEVRIDDATRDVLLGLGWTPPASA